MADVVVGEIVGAAEIAAAEEVDDRSVPFGIERLARSLAERRDAASLARGRRTLLAGFLARIAAGK